MSRSKRSPSAAPAPNSSGRGSGRHVAATVSWEADTQRVIIDPNRPLRARTTYHVVTTGLLDLAGNRLDQDPVRVGAQPASCRFTTR